MRRKTKGQSMLEYAMVIAVIVGAVYIMQHYVRRGFSGKIRESVDSVGGQYEAGKMTSTVTTEQVGVRETKDTFGIEGKGVSYYEVTTPATMNIYAEDDNAEKITSGFDEELLPED